MGQKALQSLGKGLDILFLFAEKPFLNLKEISSMSGLPKSTCYRFLNTLRKKDLVELDSGSGKYKLGLRLLRLHSGVLGSMDIGETSLPFMEELSQISGETVQLVTLNRDEGVCVEKVESREKLRVMPNKGDIIGLHSGASGKVIMAYLTEQERDRIILEKGLKKFTIHTICDRGELEQQLQKIREQGYAISDQEIYIGTTAIAAPIFDHAGKVSASISVAGPRERLTQDKAFALKDRVRQAARAISERLGAKVERM
jgi:IclR family KDG regulon transcriptional repressor